MTGEFFQIIIRAYVPYVKVASAGCNKITATFLCDVGLVACAISDEIERNERSRGEEKEEKEEKEKKKKCETRIESNNAKYFDAAIGSNFIFLFLIYSVRSFNSIFVRFLSRRVEWAKHR